MSWQTRSLPGSSGYRPSPKWVLDDDLKLSMAIAVWGASSPLTTEEEFYKNLSRPALPSDVADTEDPDATRVRAPTAKPIEKVSNDPPTAARLGLALQTWGDKIAKTDNAKRWQVAVEAAVLRREGSLLQWSWAGEFSLLISTPLGTELVAHQRSSRQAGQVSPLPTAGLGLDGGVSLMQGETVLANDARVLLLYSSALPNALLQGPLPHFDEILRLLSEEAPTVPHWIGLFEP